MGSLTQNVTNDSTMLVVATTAAVGAATALAMGLFKYRAAIRRRMEQLHRSLFFGKPNDPFRMVRMEKGMNPVHSKVKMIELNPDFVELHKEKPRMMSLGDYLSSLRPALSKEKKMPGLIEAEIQNALATVLLKSLGPQFGAAVLPALGISGVQQGVDKMSDMAMAGLLRARGKGDSDQGAVPIPMYAMSYLAEVNYQRQKSRQIDQLATADVPDEAEQEQKSPLQLLKQGEVGSKPSFSDTFVPKNGTADTTGGEEMPLVPNPFVVSKHWDQAIAGMEQLLRSQEDVDWQATTLEMNEGTPDQPHRYDPHSKAMPKPVPIDKRLLPDLHLGWGSVSCTHTQQEILKNRLLSVLLNRLASNYSFENETFQVQMEGSGEMITRPSELVQALINMGHSVETCVRTHLTTFGVALSIEEKEDGTWTEIPLAYFMESGYTDANGGLAFSCLPHSGLNLEVRGGPLLEHASIQHYLAIEGMCGWQSNHNADVPWIKDVDCGEAMHGEKAVESVRIAAMEALVLNAVGTKLRLPFGGYGLTGVCNDSAALIEYALTGENHVYPLSFNGQFAMYNLRFAVGFKSLLLSRDSSMAKEIDGLDRVIKAITHLPSDMNSLPSEANDQIRRQLHCQHPQLPFAMMKETRGILNSIQKEMECVA